MVVLLFAMRRLLLVVVVLSGLLLSGCGSSDPNVQACTDWINAQNAFNSDRSDATFRAANDALDAAIDLASGDVKRNLTLVREAEESHPDSLADALFTAVLTCRNAGADVSLN